LVSGSNFGILFRKLILNYFGRHNQKDGNNVLGQFFDINF